MAEVGYIRLRPLREFVRASRDMRFTSETREDPYFRVSTRPIVKHLGAPWHVINKRACGICERCHKEPATQVHHLRYPRGRREQARNASCERRATRMVGEMVARAVGEDGHALSLAARTCNRERTRACAKASLDRPADDALAPARGTARPVAALGIPGGGGSAAAWCRARRWRGRASCTRGAGRDPQSLAVAAGVKHEP